MSGVAFTELRTQPLRHGLTAIYYRCYDDGFPDDKTLKAAADRASALWEDGRGITDADIEAVRKQFPDRVVSREQAKAFIDWRRAEEAKGADV